MEDSTGSAAPLSPDALVVLLAQLLPDDWRHDLAVTHRVEQVVFRFRDGLGQAHGFDVRRLQPGAPSLVPGHALAYAYLPTVEPTVAEPVLDRYRAILEAMAAREAELLPWLPAEALAPGVAPSPLDAPASLGPMDENGPEWVAFAAGLKPAIRVVLAGPDAVEALARGVQARSWGFFSPAEPVQFPGNAQYIGYIARTVEAARAVADAEAPCLPDGARVADNSARQNTRVGRLLGYPPCCADAFARRVWRGVAVCPDGSRAHEDYAAAAAARRADTRPLGRLNNLLPDRGSPRLITFYPCRYDCPAAATFAGALLDVVARRSPHQAHLWRTSLLGRRGIDREGHRLAPGESSRHDPLWFDFAEF